MGAGRNQLVEEWRGIGRRGVRGEVPFSNSLTDTIWQLPPTWLLSTFGRRLLWNIDLNTISLMSIICGGFIFLSAIDVTKLWFWTWIEFYTVKSKENIRNWIFNWKCGSWVKNNTRCNVSFQATLKHSEFRV